MALELGTTDINRIYLGATDIVKLYLGSSLVFDNSAPPFDPTVFPDDDLVGGFVTGFQSDISRVKPTDKTNQSGPTSLQAYDGTGHGTGTSNGVRGDYIRGDNANRSYWVESAPEWDFGANINDPFTVSVWFKVTSTGDVQYVIMNGQIGSGRSFQISTNATVLNVWVFSNISTPNTDRLRHQVPLADITLNTWHNVVATGQGTDEANYKAWFNKTLIDGTTYGTRAVDGTFSGPAALVNQELYVSGSDIISANHGLRGNFDEIYLYKRLANQTFVNNLYDKIDGIPKFGFGESNNGINPVQGFYKVDSAGKKVFIADKYIVGGNPRLNSPGSYCSGDVMLHGFILKENSYHRMGVWYQKGSQDPKLSIPFDVPADDDNPALPADIFNHPLPVVIVDPNDNKIIAIQSAKHNTVCRIAKSTATIAQIANYTTEQFRQMAWDRLPDMVGNASGRYAYPSARFRPDGVLEIDFRTTFSVTDNYSLTRVYSDSNTINGSTVWTEKVWGLTNFTTTNRRYYPNACWNFGTCTGFISPIAIREDANTRYRAIGAVRRPFSDYNSHQNIAGTFTKNVTNTGADTTNALTESEIVTNCLVTGDPTTAAQTSTGSMIQYNDVVYLIARDHDNDLDNVILFRQAVGSATVNTVALPADFDGCQPNDISMTSWLWADVTNDKIVIRASNQVSGNVEYWQINSDLTGGWSKIIDAAGIPILPINTEDLTAPYSGPVSSALNAEETTYATQATKIFD